MKRQGAAKVCVAIPVAPEDALHEIGEQADLVVCLHPARHFYGVGAFYDDFHQLTDAETVGLLRQDWVGGADELPSLPSPPRRQVRHTLGHRRRGLRVDAPMEIKAVRLSRPTATRPCAMKSAWSGSC